MKETFTKSMGWFHTWAGLIVGWALFAIFVTGTLAVFDAEIDRWARPELHRVGLSPLPDFLDRAEAILRNTSDATLWTITPPSVRRPEGRISWRTSTGAGDTYIDPASGQMLNIRATSGGTHFEDFHAQFHSEEAGTWIVSSITVALLAILISGIVIHKRIFRDFFSFRPGGQAQRSWLDAHNLAAVLTLPFQIMIAYTGLVIEQDKIMPAGIQALYGGDRAAFMLELLPNGETRFTGVAGPLVSLAPLVMEAQYIWNGADVRFIRVLDPGDKAARVELFRTIEDGLPLSSDRLIFDNATGRLATSAASERPAHMAQFTLEGLHYAEFGGPIVRWLYFISGAAGSVMIATGLVLFTVKRRARHMDKSDATRRFYALAEKINVAAVAGVLIACIAYFWANRLLPVGMTDRAWWEIAVFFFVWLVSAPHALLRPAHRAWIEQLGFAAALCLLLPVLNTLTTDTHLLWALPRGQWAIAGVDLTALGFGVLLVLTVWKLLRRHRTAEFS